MSAAGGGRGLRVEGPHVVVIGAGIAGITAAHALRRDGPPDLQITVFESASQAGGKLRTTELAGLPVEEGAESFLARTADVRQLAAAVGIEEALTFPTTTSAGIWSRGHLRSLPPRTLLGIPGDLRALARSGVVSRAGLARSALDLVLPVTASRGDAAVGAVVRRRLGREVVDRLVDPLLGGVYAGRADALSLRATVPQLAAAQGSLVRAVNRAVPAPTGQPVFGGLVGGMSRLVDGVLASATADVRYGAPVREVRRHPVGFTVVAGSARAPEAIHADAVIVATPAPSARRLLADIAPAAAAELSGVDYASIALVTVVLPGGSLPAGTGSGWLVPAVEGRPVKAVTLLSRKWSWLGPSFDIARASIGRYGDVADVQRDDADLVIAARDELRLVLGVQAEPVATRVSRWGGALPQYAVGHVDRVVRIRSAVEKVPALTVAGAAYDGVGIPACIRSGEEAARRVLSGFAARRPR